MKEKGRIKRANEVTTRGTRKNCSLFFAVMSGTTKKLQKLPAWVCLLADALDEKRIT